MLTEQKDEYNKEFREYLLAIKQNVFVRRIVSSSLKDVPLKRDQRQKWLRGLIFNIELCFNTGEEFFDPTDIFPFDKDEYE